MKKKRWLTAGIILALSAHAPMALAAEDGTPGGNDSTSTVDVYEMDDTIVTATRNEEKVNDVPANVTVITAKDLEKKDVYNLRDALAQEAGIYVTPSAEVTGGISMRGFGTKDVLVILDGQQLNDPFNGEVDWNSIPASEVQRIEVVRGAASSLYGGHAVAGVINIITKRPANGEIHGTVNVTGGSNNTWKRGISITGGDSNKLSFRLSYDKSTTDGWRGYYKTAKGSATGTAIAQNNLPQYANGNYVIGGRGEKAFENENTKFALRYDFDDTKSLTYNYMHIFYKYDYHNPFSYLRDNNGNEIFSGTVQTQNGDFVKVKPGNYLGYVGFKKQDIHRLSYDDTGNKFKAGIGYSNAYENGYSSATTGSATSVDWTGAGGRSRHPAKNYNFDLQKTWELARHNLLAGVAWSKDEMTYYNDNLSNWTDWGTQIGDPAEKSGGSIFSTALFVQDEYKLAEKWKMYSGLRYDKFDKKDGYSYVGNVRKDYPSESFNSWSPKLAFTYAPDKRSMMFINYGKSFNPPPIYKLYRRAGDAMSTYQANPELEPETSTTYELGVKQKIDDKNSYGVTFFHIDTKDKIASSATGKYGKAYYNMNEGMTKGMELSYNHKFDDNWKSYINYTFESGDLTDSKGVTTRNYDLPKHMVAMGLDYTKDRFNAVLDARYVGARQSEDAATGEYGSEDAFFLTNLYLNYKVNDDCKVQLGVKNLFNRKFFANEAAGERMYTLGVQYSF